MTPPVEPFALSFRTTNMLVSLCLGDLSEEHARERPRGGEGPSIAWTIGHMLAYRHMALELLGAGRDNPYAAKFAQAGASDGSDYPTLAEFLEQWQRVAGELDSALETAGEETVTRPAATAGPHGGQRAIDTLAFYAYHEAYHMGSLGAIRKELGLPAPSELVIARMAKDKAASES